MGVDTEKWVWIGVDLGQRRDFSTIAVVERVLEISNASEFLHTGRNGRWWFRVRMLERIRLGTAYQEVVARVKRISQMPEIADGRTVVVDGTGVGAPVVDLMRQAGMGCRIVPLIITGTGGGGILRGGYESVARSEMLTWMQVLVQQGRLQVAARSREAQVLWQEMLGLKMNGASSAEHDDLAIAVALALWKARSGVGVI